MNKVASIVIIICALALSACAASTPVPMGFMTQDPGQNSPYSDLGN